MLTCHLDSLSCYLCTRIRLICLETFEYTLSSHAGVRVHVKQCERTCQSEPNISQKNVRTTDISKATMIKKKKRVAVVKKCISRGFQKDEDKDLIEY